MAEKEPGAGRMGDVVLQPWSEDDLALLEKLLGDPDMMAHLGGPENREQRHQFMHAFPSVSNAPSNAICRKLGFSLIEECEFEYPPGNWLTVNDWRLDLLEGHPPEP
jgi:hypothetical protein